MPRQAHLFWFQVFLYQGTSKYAWWKVSTTWVWRSYHIFTFLRDSIHLPKKVSMCIWMWHLNLQKELLYNSQGNQSISISMRTHICFCLSLQQKHHNFIKIWEGERGREKLHFTFRMLLSFDCKTIQFAYSYKFFYFFPCSATLIFFLVLFTALMIGNLSCIIWTVWLRIMWVVGSVSKNTQRVNNATRLIWPMNWCTTLSLIYLSLFARFELRKKCTTKQIVILNLPQVGVIFSAVSIYVIVTRKNYRFPNFMSLVFFFSLCICICVGL